MNRWIADRGYGSGMALAFNGDPEFIRRSVNFAINFLVHDASNIHEYMPSFVVVNTSMERLGKALYDEAFARESLKLSQESSRPNPLSVMQDEDFPDDFNEKCVQFRADLHAARNWKEVQAVLARDPTVGIFEIELDPEIKTKASELARNSVREQLAALVFEDFMRRVSQAGVMTHQVSEEIA